MAGRLSVNILDDFKGRTAIVAGATGPLGLAMCVRLARAGAYVVALDRDADALLCLEKIDPKHINALHMAVHDWGLFERLGDVWADEPLHFLFNFLPMHQSERKTRHISVKTALMDVLAPDLAAGQGTAVTVLQEAHGGAPISQHGQVGAILSMLKAQNPSLNAQGVRSNAIVLGAGLAGQSAMSPALYLASRFSRRLNGVVLPLHGPSV